MNKSPDTLELEAFVAQVERALEGVGATAWEVWAVEDHETTAEAMNQRLNVVENREERAIAIRVLDRGIGFSSILGGGMEAIGRAVDAAHAEARLVRPAAILDFAAPQPDVLRLADQGDPRVVDRAPAELATLALELEAHALRTDRRITGVRPAQVTEARGRILLRTSAGWAIEERYTRAHASVGAVAEHRGEVALVSASTSASSLEGLALTRAAERAAGRAARRIGARTFKSEIVPVVLDPEVVADFLEVVLAALDGESFDRGASFLAGPDGPRALSSAISVLDRPRDRALEGASWFDGEGLATQDRALMEHGIVRGLLDVRDSAARAGRAAFASATRSGALSPPRPGAHGPHLVAGTEPREALLRAAEGGLYVAEVAGAHLMDEINGELSLGATGWILSSGGWAEPVEGVVLAGNLLELLGDGVRLSAETEVHAGMRVPTMMWEAVQVSSTG